jgi:hypothetical protein
MAGAKAFLDGLRIILEKEPEADLCAEHDIIYVGSENSVKLYSREERKKLDEMEGWHQTEFKAWGFFT